jgi:RHS repeat-associated protein
MDGHSGVRVLTDKLGNLTDTSSYDAYGNVTNPLSAEFGYRGESFEDLTRLQYLRARYYEPSTGRFLGVDPFEGDVNNPVSRHRYLYGNANPVSYSDPSGKFSINEATAAILVFDVLLSLRQVLNINTNLKRSNGQEITWTGQVGTGGYSSEMIGIPSLLAATVAGARLTSDYDGWTTSGLWLLLGIGLSASPLDARALSATATTNELTILSPSNLGNRANVLSGQFSSMSINAVTFVGFSFTNLFMGYGYSRISNLDIWGNRAFGWDVSLGITSGISINIASSSIRY